MGGKRIKDYDQIALNMNKDVAKLETIIDYNFNDRKLLKQALTHPSFSSEAGKQRFKSNQRLEFLGDAVLELVASEFLYKKHPTEEEGELTRRRASLVFESALALCAENIGLGDFIYLGVGETKANGYEKPSILSDAFEALIGAIYLDGGINEARRFIASFVLSSIDELSLLGDFKSLIQQFVQSAHGRTLRYETLSQTDDAKKQTFMARLYIDENLISEGIGNSKKEAQQDAAHKACKKLDIV